MADTKLAPEEQRTLILTGASRGIGHATVKRFSSAGWRVITCSHHAFPENCPWAAGPEDHIQVDLSDPQDTLRAVDEMRGRLKDGRLHALVNNAGVSPKGNENARLSTLTSSMEVWRKVFEVNLFSTIWLARGLWTNSLPRKALSST
jgi:NAD(P)-dependent dehydrogenase (short-subunit alcohol dehydrogenase family)